MVEAKKIMNSDAIITLADSNYFELLDELIDSIKIKNRVMFLSVFDAGLTENKLMR